MNLINDVQISAEMLVHVPLCTHKEPKNILILSANEQIKDELLRYEELSFELVNDNFAKAVEGFEDKKFDVVVVDGASEINAVFVAQVNRVLKNDGLCVIKTNAKKELMSDCGTLFGIVMPYRYTNTSAYEEIVLASKRFHPTADIILQRSDLLDGHSYYNTEIHLASFALATYERKELAGIYKQ